MNKKPMTGVLRTHTKILLVIFPIICALASLSIGRMSLPLGDVLSALFGGTVDKQTQIVVTTIRMPRVILALLTGAGLSVAGCAYQTLFSNPLATPDTLGVASGSGFGAALGILMGFNLVGIQLTALLAGLAAVFITGMAGSGFRRSMGSTVLAGIMVGSLFSALISLAKFVADTESQLPAITYWLMGSMSSAGYETLSLGAPPIVAGIIVLFAVRWRLNLLPLSDDEARASGVNITAIRTVTVIAATLITASCVSMCGQVGWIGLLIPHMCRMMFGNNHLSIVPASICLGSGFMVIVDTLARTATASEIPLSIITAIIGAPFFIYLLRRKGGWQL